MKKVAAYQCDHCSMTSLRASSVQRHERDYCRKSPVRKRCGNCLYYSHEPGETHHNHPNEMPYTIAPSWYCLKYDNPIDSNYLNDNTGCMGYCNGEENEQDRASNGST